MSKKSKAFTLIELLVVIAIIGILVTIAVIALNSARSKARDAKRVANIKQVQTALELFFNDKNRYPTLSEYNSGALYSTSSFNGTTTYMEIVPEAPTPPDGNCTNNQNQFSYTPTNNGGSYTISYCLGNPTGSIAEGPHCATPSTIAGGACDGSGGNNQEPLQPCLVDPTGCSWAALSTSGFPNNSGYASFGPQVLVSNNVVYVGYAVQTNPMSYYIYKYIEQNSGGSWQQVGSTFDSIGWGAFYIDNGVLFAATADSSNGYLHVWQYNGSNWVEFAGGNIGVSNVEQLKLVVYQGRPVVLYLKNDGLANLIMWNGSSWTEPMTDLDADLGSLGLTVADDFIYMSREMQGGRGDVVFYDINSGSIDGFPPFFETTGYRDSAIYAADGAIYVAYLNNDGHQAIVKKMVTSVYQNNSNTPWEVLGAPNFQNSGEQIDIFIYNSIPYIASAGVNSQFLKYTNSGASGWNDLSPSGYGSGDAVWSPFIFIANDIPYMVLDSHASGFPLATVIRFSR